MEGKRKILVICGPTATGKTALGINLAEKLNGEIVSADSRQVYKGMDIGTGKDLPESSKLQSRQSSGVAISNRVFPSSNLNFKNLKLGYYSFNSIPVWFLDIVNPDYKFSVADYVECANSVIEDILKRGKLPILVGGTGLYINGLIDGIETMGVPPDWELRERLSHYSIVQLSEELKKMDFKRWQSLNNSDRNNPRRLVRAIEIAQYKSTSEVGGTPPKARGDTSEVKGNILFIGLTAPYSVLYQRIDQRVDARVQEGVEKEIKNLLKQGYSWDSSALGTTIGYKEWREYMEHAMPAGRQEIRNTEQRGKAIQQWKFAEHGYARRQMTWFKKDKRINWFEIDDIDFREKIVDLLKKWYNKV